MTYQVVVFLSIVAFSIGAQAQKLYKTMDENGNVSFSQYPPATQEETVKVENLTVTSSPQSTVSEKLDGMYCGDIRLPKPPSTGSESTSYTKTLDRSLSSWKQQLDDVSRRVDQENQRAIENRKSRHHRYGQYNSDYQNQKSKQYRNSIDKNSGQLRDLRCAIGWAENEFDGREEVVYENNAERERLETIRSELELTLASRCGELTPYDPRDQVNEGRRKQWHECSSDLRRELNRINQQINQI